MPVSSPSYFPPAGSQGQIVGTTAGRNATGVRTFLAGANAAQFTQPINDLIVVGDNAMSAGTQAAPITDAALNGSIIVGSSAAAALTATQSFGAGFQGASTIVGFNALAKASQASSNTLVGAQIASSYTIEPTPSWPFGGNVVMGEEALGNLDHGNFGAGQGITQNVVIGTRTLRQSATQKPSLTSNVIIGYRMLTGIVASGTLGGAGVARNVLIGAGSGTQFQNVDSATGSTDNVYIGYQFNDVGSPRGNVVIGSGGQAGGGVISGPTNNVGIGSTTTGGIGVVCGTDANVVIGADGLNNTANKRCVLLGRGVGGSNIAGGPVGLRNDQFLVETVDGVPGGTRRTLLYGVICDGVTAGTGLVIGFSTEGTNRDIQGVNTLKIVNGVKGGANPLGGGYFYVTGGVLHWVDSAGVDTQVSLSAAGQLASSALSAYTNNAGAAAGTLTNAPIAGNPTKWVPVNDNGTIRNLPLW